MPHNPKTTFRAKWLIQSSLSALTGLGVSANDYMNAAAPDTEWDYVNALRTPLGISASTWAVIESSPFLRLFPRGTPKTTGKLPEYKFEGTGLNYSAGPVQRSFDVQITTQVQGVYEALRHIADLSNYGDLSRHRPILILDFAWPEVRDIILSRPTGYPAYTTRLGMIRNLQSGGPAGGYPAYDQFSGVGGSGISFEFVEATLRRAS